MNILSNEALTRLIEANSDCSDDGDEDVRLRRAEQYLETLGIGARTVVATEVTLIDTISND